MAYNRPVCNCPDASNKVGKNLFQNYYSTTFDRNWKTRTNSDGSTNEFGGIRQQGYYCYHELCVIRERGEMADAFPNGIPYQPVINDIAPIDIEQPPQSLQSDSLFIKPISEVV
jgi:hypothetical protein